MPFVSREKYPLKGGEALGSRLSQFKYINQWCRLLEKFRLLMKFGIDLPNFGEFSDPSLLAELAKNAEYAGWDGFFLWDHIARPTEHDVVDPWIALAAVAMNTHKIRIGTMVTPLPRRRPWIVARETVSLDRLSNGRFIFGVGSGAESGYQVEWKNFREELNPVTRGIMLDESLDIITGLWQGESFNYEGSYYTVLASKFTPVPIQRPRIPIWVGGSWPNKAPFRRAARWDGMCPLLNRSDSFAHMKAAVKYTLSYRKHQSYFDIVYLSPPTSHQRAEFNQIIRPFAEIGVTWWIEKIDPPYFGTDWNGKWNFKAMREHILQGPPHYER